MKHILISNFPRETPDEVQHFAIPLTQDGSIIASETLEEVNRGLYDNFASKIFGKDYSWSISAGLSFTNLKLSLIQIEEDDEKEFFEMITDKRAYDIVFPATHPFRAAKISEEVLKFKIADIDMDYLSKVNQQFKNDDEQRE